MVSVAGLPSPQGSQTVTGTVAVSNFPASVEVSNDVGNPLPVSGTVTISGTIPVSGTVSVANFPTSVEVSNDVGNPLPVSGTVAVSNFPATQPVSGTVTANQGTSPWVVSGTVAISGTVPVSIAGAVTVIETGMTTPTTSLNVQSAIQNGTVLDDGGMRAHHTIVVITSAGVSAGTVLLQLSQDNTNWFTAVTISTTQATTLYSADVVGAFRYSRATITGTITGGTITATIASV